MSKKALALGMAAIAGTSLMAAPALAATPDADVPGSADKPLVVKDGIAAQCDAMVKVAKEKVQGTFSFAQDEVSTNEEIAKAAGAAKYLCNSAYGPEQSTADPLEWTVAINGQVGHQMTATVEELSEKGTAHVRMGCVCAANGSGGFAVMQADIDGITLRSIMSEAEVADEVNTIVFTSSDGYQIALPRTYVEYRYSMLVYKVNGEPLANNVGGYNQLWLGSTPGMYFARDVVEITFEARQTPPPNPFTPEGDEYYGNFPGIGISSAQAE